MQHALNFQYKLFHLQPPLQYSLLSPFFTSDIFHLTVSPPHVLPKPSLQSLSAMPSSMPQLFFNSLLVHTAFPTVSTKNPFPSAVFQPAQAATRAY